MAFIIGKLFLMLNFSVGSIYWIWSTIIGFYPVYYY